MGSASYLAAGLVRGLCPSQAMPGPWCSISAPLLPDTLQSTGLAAAYWGHLYPQGKGTDRDSSRLSATFGLVVGGREVSDPHNPPKIPIGGGQCATVLAPIFAAWDVLLLIYRCQPPLGAPLKLYADPMPNSPPALSPLSIPTLPVPAQGLADTAVPCPSCLAMPGLCNRPRVCPGFALLPRKRATGTSPGLLLGETAGYHHPPTPSPFLLQREPGRWGASKRSPACPALQETCALVPMGAEIWAVGFAGALRLPSASVLPCVAPAKCRGAGGSGRSRAP